MKSIKGLALFALALVALVVVPASASAGTLSMTGSADDPVQVAAPKYPAQPNAKQEGQVTLITNGVGKVTCESAKYSGPNYFGPKDLLVLKTDTASCKLGGSPATVEMPNCSYEFTDFDYLGAAFRYGARAAFTCSGSTGLTISSAGCVISIPEQSLGPVGTGSGEGTNISNTAAGGMFSTTVASGLEYTVSSAFTCKLAGFTAGTNHDGQARYDLNVSGLSLTGGTPVLEAGSYPATASGGLVKVPSFMGRALPFEAEGVTVSCTGASGESEAFSKPVDALSLSMSYSGCRWTVPPEVNVAATVDMNGCHFEYSNFLASPWNSSDYSATIKIVCGEGGGIKVLAPSNLCTVTIPPQTLTSGPAEAGFGNSEFGGEASLISMTVGSNLEYSAPESFGCKVTGLKGGGTRTNGSTRTELLLDS